MKKKAVITGVNGQDGSYLAEFLLNRGYEVHGISKPVKNQAKINAHHNVRHLLREDNFFTHFIDVTNDLELIDLMAKIQPDEIYHMAAQSHTPKSFEDPWETFHVNVKSVITLLEFVRQKKHKTKFFFAASSELFGDAVETPQNENTKFNPRSPYGVTKICGYYLTKIYREKYSIFSCSGIFFSHESPRRSEVFVTKKITSTVAKIKNGIETELRLGNLDTKRDWGFSKDFVEAAWLMMQQDIPIDYVIGTGETHTIKEFVEEAFSYVGLDWRDYVVVDTEFFRSSEKNPWLADTRKAQKELGWSPKTSFKQLVKIMMDSELYR